jgi:hypothetical protein
MASWIHKRPGQICNRVKNVQLGLIWNSFFPSVNLYFSRVGALHRFFFSDAQLRSEETQRISPELDSCENKFDPY